LTTGHRVQLVGHPETAPSPPVTTPRQSGTVKKNQRADLLRTRA
jgi:hypothetical protein